MEMELCEGEIQSHCTDVLDSSLALIRSAICSRGVTYIQNKLEFVTYNQEQYNNLDKTIHDIMTTFTDYYYVVGDNYLEHPYLGTVLVEGEELKDYYTNYFDNNPLFKVEYEKISDTTNKILFSIKDKDKCLQAFDEYCSSYGYDCVFNNDSNLLTCEAQDKQLYELLTENDYNLRNFVVKDLKYIKALCYNEYLDKLSISNVHVDFDDDNKLSFKCTIEGSKFVEEYGKEDTREENSQEDTPKTNKVKRRRTHFAPSVQDLYDYIKKYAPVKNFEIYKDDLIDEDRRNKLYCGMGELTTAVNRLNQQYKEISNTDTILMKYDKFLDCYIITNIWNN